MIIIHQIKFGLAKKEISLFCCLFLFSFGAYAQLLKGKIIDEETKVGLANVQLRLGVANTISNSDGTFEFHLPKGKYKFTAKLLGYHSEEEDIDIPQINFLIALKPQVKQLEEVVVSTGYQKIPKERATGSFSSLNEHTFNQQVTTGVLERLEGVMPTITVDRRSNAGGMMIRGLSTLRGERDPLIILDQFPYEGDINNINPADVESITILKDAAASSIWGAKAGNGVIVITTKAARFKEAFSLNASLNTSILSMPNLYYRSLISSADLIANERMLFSKGYFNSRENASNRPAQSEVVELLIAARDGKITPDILQQQLDLLSGQDIRQNYADAFLKQAINRQYNFTMQGGSEKMNWLLFAGYDDNKTSLNATYQRFNLKIDNNWRPLKNLELGVNLAYSQSNSEAGKIDLASMSTASGQLPTYTRFMSSDGVELPVMNQYSIRYLATLNGLLNWNYYPVSEPEGMVALGKTNDLLINVKLNYKILKGLNLNLNYQHERQRIDNSTIYSLESYYTRNLINQFSQINGTNITRPVPLGAILDTSSDVLRVNNGRAQLNYEEFWGDFNLNVLAGGEIRESRNSNNSFRSYGLDQETMSSVSVDFANSYKNLVTGSANYIANGLAYNASVTKYVSAYSNAALSFRKKYTFSASARRDASNLFGVATNNKWNPFWSAGLAWNLSEEDFAEKLPYLKLRATYGSSGNSDNRLAALTTISYSIPSPYTQLNTATFSNYANPDLRWEKTKTLNFGIDFKFFQNRITGSIDYYIKKSDDLISTEPIDYTTGIGYVVTRNAAKIGAKGLDIELKSLNVNRALKWNTDFFINFYKDKVLNYYLESKVASNFINGGATVSGAEGMPVYSIYAYKWAGLNPSNGNPRGYVNGQVSENYTAMVGSTVTLSDLEYFGPAFPTLTGAVGNAFEWKNFNLNFRINYKFGSYFRRPSLNYTSLFSTRNGSAEYAERWQNPGDELTTNVPSEIYPAVGNRDSFYNYSAATIVSGDLIRLQYIGLGYTLSKRNLKSLPFQQLTLQMMANNLGLLWRANHYGLDPDYPVSEPLKTYSLSLKINL